jgi:integrase
LEQILHTLHAMPSATDIERRDRAVLAFTILTGVRDGAMVSLKLKHLDLEQACVHQDAREVRTKFSKTFTTWFFPVDKAFRQVVFEWVAFLRTEKLWGLDDPLFPATRVTVGPEGKFAAAGLDRKHWRNATPIRAIFRQAFERVGFPYFNPHSFRKTLVGLGEQLCTTPEQFKAWSQNLGHEQVMTTFTSYGAVGTARQAEIIRQLAQSRQQDARAKARLLELLDEV